MTFQEQATQQHVFRPATTDFHQTHVLEKPFTTALKAGLGLAVAALVVVLTMFLLTFALIAANSSDTGGTTTPSSSLICNDGSVPLGGVCADGTPPS